MPKKDHDPRANNMQMNPGSAIIKWPIIVNDASDPNGDHERKIFINRNITCPYCSLLALSWVDMVGNLSS